MSHNKRTNIHSLAALSISPANERRDQDGSAHRICYVHSFILSYLRAKLAAERTQKKQYCSVKPMLQRNDDTVPHHRCTVSVQRKCCCLDSFSQEARSSPGERAQGSYAALRASLKLGMPMHKLRRDCAAGKILDGKAFGGRCAGQKSWRGTHVVLLCFLRKVLCYSRQST